MTTALSKHPLADAIASIDFSRELPAQTQRKSRSAALPLGALMLAASVSSWAQNTPSAEQSLPEIQVKDVEVSSKETLRTTKTRIGKGVQDIRDIPQSITVMTEKLLDDANRTTLKEALQYTSGITFAAAENGTDQDIRMRGFPVAQTGDLMLDGMRDPSQYDRDAFNYDKIEVMRGSASMLFGRGSTGGVINQVSKKPFLNNQSEVNTTVGTRQAYRLTGDFNIMTGEESALRLNVMGNKADNNGANIKKYGIAPTFSWGIGTRDEFTIGAFHLDVDNIPKVGVPYSGMSFADPNGFYGSEADYLKSKATYVHGSHTHTFGDGGTLRTQARTGQFDRNIWSSQLTAGRGVLVTSPNHILTRSGLRPRKQNHETTYLQSDYNNLFTLAGMQHDVLIGVDVSHEQAKIADRIDSSFTSGKGTGSLNNPGAGATIDPRVPQFKDHVENTVKTVGVYAQDTIAFAPSWKLLAGVRFERFDGEFKVVEKAPVSMGQNLFSYRTGLLFQPTSTSSYHISYSTSFNTAGDTYQYTATQTTHADTIKALNTDPEKSRNIELGAKLDWLDGALSTRGALFHTEKYNERTTDDDFANDSFLMSGKRHTRGLELDIVGKLTKNLELYLSYTNIFRSKIDEAGSKNQNIVGKSVGLTPKHSYAVWLGYQPTETLRLATGITGRSENFAISGTTSEKSDNARVPGYATFDAMIDYKINNTWSAKLNIANIFNKSYGDQLYPGFVILGDGRTAQLTLTTKF